MESGHWFLRQTSQRGRISALLFFYQLVTGIDHNLVDLVQYFRGKQGDVILQSLDVIRVGTVRSVSEHLPQCTVFIGQLLKAVVVAVDGQTQGAKNQYFPEIHTRAAIVTAGGYHSLKGMENLRSQLWGDPDMLKSPQEAGYVVPGFGVEGDGRDIDLA